MAIEPLKRLRVIVGAAVVCVVLPLLAIYPYRPKSVTGWVVFFLAAPPILFGLEVAGNAVFLNPKVSRLPRTVRIAYGVVALAVILSLLAAVGDWWSLIWGPGASADEGYPSVGARSH